MSETTTKETSTAVAIANPVTKPLREVTIVQSNKLTQARYDFSVAEKRAVYILIDEVRKQFVEGVTMQRNLFNDLLIHISTRYLSQNNLNLREIYDAMKSLRDKKIWVNEGGEHLELGFISHFDHEFRSSYIQIETSHKILPYLVELASHFTAYNLTVAIGLKTKYGQRLYEYCSQYENNDPDPKHTNSGYFYLTLKDLRQKFMVESKYPRYALIKKFVIDPAHKEIKELYDAGQCNLYFEYREEKYGRTVERLHFFVYSKNMRKNAVNSDNLLDQIYYIRIWLEEWLAVKKRPRNKEWVNKTISHLNMHPDLITRLYKRLAKLKAKEPLKNHAALARYIIEEDFLR